MQAERAQTQLPGVHSSSQTSYTKKQKKKGVFVVRAVKSVCERHGEREDDNQPANQPESSVRACI